MNKASSIAERLYEVLDFAQISQEALADKIGVSQVAISKILNGKTKHPRNIVEIANVLNVDPTWLKTGEGDAPDFSGVPINFSENRGVIEENDDLIRVSVLDVEASCGNGLVPLYDNAEAIRDMVFTRDFFLQQFGRTSSKGINLINAKGDSMEPTIKSGAVIFVDTAVREFCGDGIYFFTFDGQRYLKRLQAVKNKFLVISDNDCYKSWEITREEEDRLQIWGRALQILDLVWRKVG